MKMTKDGKIVEVPNNLISDHILNGWVEYKEENISTNEKITKIFSKKADLKDNEKEQWQ